MKMISLLPADTYNVINKCLINDIDYNIIISLYQPIIGATAMSLYFTLINDIKNTEYISADYTHHHLMATLKTSLEAIKNAREVLEGVGLLRTYFKEGETNSYVYEVFSPVSPKEFFSSPIFNVTLYNYLGKNEYDNLKNSYELPKFNLKEYEDISKRIDSVYKTSSSIPVIDAKDKNTLSVQLDGLIDFDLIVSSIPKGLINESIFNKKNKQLIEQLSFVYDIDTLKMIEIIRSVLNNKGTFDKEELRLTCRKYYQYNNSGKLPTLVYRTQPDYLSTPMGDTNPLTKIIYMFEHTSPYDFLRIKNKGAQPTSRDLKLIEDLMIDLELQPAVVNVLIDYVLKKNNNKLNRALVETIAGQWKRCKVETAKEAIELAKKENTKYNKKVGISKKINEPVWFNKEIKKEEISMEEAKELEDLLKDFR